jgi:hypothetical protein
MTISEQFKDFWGTYGQFIGLFAGGFVVAYAKVIFDKRKKRHEDEHILKCCPEFLKQLLFKVTQAAL